jgi:hypothetical protein
LKYQHSLKKNLFLQNVAYEVKQGTGTGCIAKQKDERYRAETELQRSFFLSSPFKYVAISINIFDHNYVKNKALHQFTGHTPALNCETKNMEKITEITVLRTLLTTNTTK